MIAIRIIHLPAQLVVWLRRRARRLVRRRALHRALQAAYKPFARAHARWVASFFDDHFLTVHAVPLLMDTWDSSWHLLPAQLAEAWCAQFPPTSTFTDELRTEAIQVAANFLELLEKESRHATVYGYPQPYRRSHR
jgi:hypothetical protein